VETSDHSKKRGDTEKPNEYVILIIKTIQKMRTFKILSIIILTSILMTSCGIHSAMVGNINNNNTNVELSKKNFKVIEKVSGNSTATYVFGIGGLSNKALIEKAKFKMLENANLIGGSKAIINWTTESHISIVYPFFYQKTITVSGHIVEFIE